jgi:hypothetical protein
MIVVQNNCRNTSLYAKFVIPFAYALTLSALPVQVFSDRQSYFNYVTDSWFLLLRNWQQGILPLLANEPVWLLLNALLGSFLSPENTIRLIVFVAAFIVSRYLLICSAYPLTISILLLLFPVLLQNHLCALRNALAASLFLIGWYSNATLRRWLFLLLTPFVHIAFFLILVLIVVSKTLVRLRFGADVRQLVFIIIGILVALGAVTVAQMVGARHGYEYQGVVRAGEVSGLGFLFWFFVLGLMFLEGKTYLRENVLCVAAITFYLTSYLFTDIGARAFESVVAPVLVTCTFLTGVRRRLFLAVISVYMVVFYVTRSGQPWLGFAA